jgi:membrane protease YdiL (CAAX protease family)
MNKLDQMDQEIKLALIRVLPFAIIIVALFVFVKQKKIKLHDLDINKPPSINRFCIWTVGFLIFILSTEFIFYKLGILEIDKWHHPLYPSIIRLLGAVLLAPVAEELIFRGLALNALIKRRLNIHFAIFIQACFFVLLHNFTYQNTLSSNIGIIQSLIDACLFGYARHFTRSIYTPITMHITGNFIAILERFIF